MDANLAELAAAHGVATSYDDWSGKPVEVSPEAVTAALSALGVDATDVDAALVEVDEAPWRTLLPPSLVIRGAGSVVVRGPAEPTLLVATEDGGSVPVTAAPVAGEVRGDRTAWTVDLPGLPLGWHSLRATSGAETAEAVLVVAPERIELPPGLERTWGWMVQLYSLRSARSWGMGDYADLRTVLERAAADGAGAVLLNPLHAETPVVPLNPSPYSPSSRRFRSAVYLRIEDVPEYTAEVDALRPPTDPERIDRDTVWEAKLAALEQLWPAHRADALAAYRAEQGAALEDYALFCALAEQHGVPWQDWPAEVRRPDGDGIAAARTEHADRIAFWCWVQLLVDEQLAGLGADMTIGVVHDLAVGVDAGGADAWALQDALALTTTVGAPPDSFNQKGQDWGLPPWRPDRLRELGYAPYRDVVRGCLRHAGGLRIDHVMGLFRLWWVPQGSTADQGTYVSYDADAMLGILALEASRGGALVVGEDLGTVEDRVRTALEGTGVLGSAVLWFETEEDGSVVPPKQWRPLALASVTTHDLPTAAGFLAEEQVRVRAELDQLATSVEDERAKVREEREHLLDMLRSTGLLDQYDGDVVLAMHGALVASPCRVVLAAYGDAVGDLRQPNLPGTVDEYPNWRLPVADAQGRPLSLEELLDHPAVRRLTALLADGVKGVR
ncbi:MAG: 4-alpha-glucanotransferase [Actinobacteria bacterium]|nr:4-alpha-glucanotransferase [Actinomycetota bacterium]MCA1721406.1 4-alpha-glucanotransferase [Actinomycetota bacterium]